MYQYRAYVKDVLDLTAKPKAFMIVTSFTIRRDLLATANSSFKCLSIPNNIDNDDIFCLYNPKGKVIYQGVINSVSSNTIQCKQIQSFYKGTWLYETMPSSSLEEEIYKIIDRYSKGYINENTIDPLMQKKYGSITVKYIDSNKNHLVSKEPQTTEDMENFIYSLYDKYGIIFEFDFPYESDKGGTCLISTPTYTSIKVANNTHAITDISPVTKISEKNKLIIYSSEGEYRASYFATSDGITQNPNDPLRLKTINTVIQFSDDELDSIVQANLKSEMYNHKLTFNLLFSNNLYDWYDWKLGQPIEVYYNSKYYKSVYTGYELTKEDNSEPISVKITCGKVRTSLTKKLSLGAI